MCTNFILTSIKLGTPLNVVKMYTYFSLKTETVDKNSIYKLNYFGNSSQTEIATRFFSWNWVHCANSKHIV